MASADTIRRRLTAAADFEHLAPVYGGQSHETEVGWAYAGGFSGVAGTATSIGMPRASASSMPSPS